MSDRGPTLGVHLLETITKGMYSEPLHCLREYVQNAYDSIRAARHSEMLGVDEGEIRIFIDRELRSVRIRDNGTGMDPEEASVYLLDLGNSSKAGTATGSSPNAGFRGIGRMAGITYCDKLRFETSNGQGRTCSVEFDAAAINRLTRAGEKAVTIMEAFQSHSRIVEGDEEWGRRYCEVILDGINMAGESFLDDDRVGDYLAQCAPVSYDPEWKFGEKIRSFAREIGSMSSLDHIVITLRDPEGGRLRDVRRPFRNTFQVVNKRGDKRARRTVRVEDVLLLPKEGSPAAGWWGWLAVHERAGALADVPFSGLRVRMHNIMIGDESVLKPLFATTSHASWCFGEIHITDHDLTPNAQRDNFEDSRGWRDILEQLREEARWIGSDIRRESERRSKSVEKIRRRTDVILKGAERVVKRGVVSPEEQEIQKRKIEGEIEKLQREESRKNRSEQDRKVIGDIRRELEGAAGEISAVKKTGADMAQAHLGRETRRALRTVREILQSELDDDTFVRIIEKINVALRPGGKATS